MGEAGCWVPGEFCLSVCVCVHMCVHAYEYRMVCSSSWCGDLDSEAYMSEYQKMRRLGSRGSSCADWVNTAAAWIHLVHLYMQTYIYSH